MKNIVVLSLIVVFTGCMMAQESQVLAVSGIKIAEEAPIAIHTYLCPDNTISVTVAVKAKGFVRAVEVTGIKDDNLALAMPDLKVKLRTLTENLSVTGRLVCDTTLYKKEAHALQNIGYQRVMIDARSPETLTAQVQENLVEVIEGLVAEAVGIALDIQQLSAGQVSGAIES